nr:unnamed protein product [Haemonchus contortus]
MDAYRTSKRLTKAAAAKAKNAEMDALCEKLGGHQAEKRIENSVEKFYLAYPEDLSREADEGFLCRKAEVAESAGGLWAPAEREGNHVPQLREDTPQQTTLEESTSSNSTVSKRSERGSEVDD